MAASTDTRSGVPSSIEHAKRAGHDAPVLSARDEGESPRRFVVWFLAGLAALLIGVFGFNALVDPYGGLGTGLLPTAITDDPAIKVRLLEKLPRAPQLVVLGSSRSLKADPAFLRQHTGLRSFNAGVRGGTTVEAYALARYVHDRWPSAHTRFLILLDVESFRWGNLDTTLLNTSQLARYLPLRERVQQRLSAIPPLLSWNAAENSLRVVRAEQDGTASHADQVTASRTSQFRPDGFLRRDRYDPVFEREKYLDIYRGGAFSRLQPRPLHYLQAAITQMDKWGTPPLIVLTPIDPKLQKELRRMGWNQRYHDLLADLARLHRSHPFTLADMTKLSSFGGDPSAFYDHVHMRPSNMRLMLEQVLKEHGSALQ